MPKKAFTKGRKQDFEILMMYNWLVKKFKEALLMKARNKYGVSNSQMIPALKQAIAENLTL